MRSSGDGEGDDDEVGESSVIGTLPVMRRAPRWNVRYESAHSNITMKRFLKPIRKKTWMSSQAIHARKPESLSRPKSAIPEARPIVASEPLSW